MFFTLCKYQLKDFNLKPETLKLLRERVGSTLKSVGIDNNYLNRTPTVQQLSEKIDKWDYMKIKSFCIAKEMVIRLKKQSTEWDKTFLSSTSDKGLITRLYREINKLNSQGINGSMKKWANWIEFFQRKKKKWPKIPQKEVLNIPGHERNANWNYIKILLHSC
jgi:hypothetical protein